MREGRPRREVKEVGIGRGVEDIFQALVILFYPFVFLLFYYIYLFNTAISGSFPRGPCNDCDLSDYIHSSAGGSSNKKYRMRTTFENHAYLELMIS